MQRPDEYIAWIARKQHGVFTTEQSRTAGFSEHQLRDRVDRGQWVRLARNPSP